METRIGLVLGKFAPLHRGHQFLIEAARAQVDRLYVLIYEDEGLSKVSLAQRARWIRYLYPDVHVIEGHGSPTRTGLDDETKRIQDAYIKSIMPERITDFFSSEKYGVHVSLGLGAANIVVDQERSKHHISATRIRDNPTKMRKWMHPYVYRDLIQRIVLLGAESTGKSTLAAALGNALNTTVVPEYGREYWIQNHDKEGRLNSDDMVAIAAGHRALEDRACETANRFCVVDTNALTTRQFCLSYGHKVPLLLYNWAHTCSTRYSWTFVCGDEIPFVQDGTRQTSDARRSQQSAIIADLTHLRIKYQVVTGSIEERVQMVLDIVGQRG